MDERSATRRRGEVTPAPAVVGGGSAWSAALLAALLIASGCGATITEARLRSDDAAPVTTDPVAADPSGSVVVEEGVVAGATGELAGAVSADVARTSGAFDLAGPTSVEVDRQFGLRAENVVGGTVEIVAVDGPCREVEPESTRPRPSARASSGRCTTPIPSTGPRRRGDGGSPSRSGTRNCRPSGPSCWPARAPCRSGRRSRSRCGTPSADG